MPQFLRNLREVSIDFILSLIERRLSRPNPTQAGRSQAQALVAPLRSVVYSPPQSSYLHDLILEHTLLAPGTVVATAYPGWFNTGAWVIHRTLRIYAQVQDIRNPIITVKPWAGHSELPHFPEDLQLTPDGHIIVPPSMVRHWTLTEQPQARISIWEHLLNDETI